MDEEFTKFMITCLCGISKDDCDYHAEHTAVANGQTVQPRSQKIVSACGNYVLTYDINSHLVDEEPIEAYTYGSVVIIP